MEVNRLELLGALEKVKPGLAGKELIEQSTSFAFINGRVVSYNDEISISHPVDIKETGAVKAQSLYSFLNKVNKEEITVLWEENELRIKAGRARAGLVFEKEIKLPLEEIEEITTWQDLPKGFVEALEFCLPTCSKDMSRIILTCIYIDKRNVISSDSFQISKYKLAKKFPTKPILLPASAAVDLIKYDIKQIAVGDSWLHFRTEDGTIFSSRTFQEEYPEVDHFFDVEGVEITFPKTALQILERAQVFAKSEFKEKNREVVRVQLFDGKMEFAADNETGWFKESCKTDYSGEKISFHLRVDFLITLLKQASSCLYGDNKIKFTGEGWEHVVAVVTSKENEA